MSNFTGQKIKDTYQSLLQISGSNVLADGTGSVIAELDISASYATTAGNGGVTAIIAGSNITVNQPTGNVTVSAVIPSVETGSLLETASFSNPDITFTRANGTTFDIDLSTLVPTSASHAVQADSALTAISASYATFASTATSASYSATATSASHALYADNAGFAADVNALYTASISNATITFEKGDTSTFNIVVNNVVNATSASHAVQADNATTAGSATTATSASHAVQADNATTADSATSASYASNAELLDGLDSTAFAILSANNVFSGATNTFNNLVVNGTASINYLQSVTGSAKIVGDAFIILNNDTPIQNYAGVKVQDSGSNTTASFQFDGANNNWFYEYDGVGHDYGVALFGPGYSNIANPVYPVANQLQKGTGDHHLTGSLLSDDGTTVSMTGIFDVTGGVTASAGFLGNLTGDVVGTASTASYIAGANVDGAVAAATSASYALTASYVPGAGAPFPYTGSADISGSINLNGFITGSHISTDPTTNTVVLGPGITSRGTINNVQIGWSADVAAGADYATVIGSGANAGSSNDVTIGADASTGGGNSIAIGSNATANQLLSLAVGQGAAATGVGGAAFGLNASAGNDSVALGGNANTNNQAGSVALGNTAIVNAGNQIVIGYTSTASGTGTIAIGSGASGASTGVVMGYQAGATGSNATVVGYQAGATSTNGTAIGYTAEASTGGTALGYDARATNTNATAVGFGADATGTYTVAIGSSADASSNYGIAIGANATASADYEINLGSIFTYNGSSLITLYDSTNIRGGLTVEGNLIGDVSALSIVSSTASMDCSAANFFTLTLGNGVDTHLDATNIQTGQTINLKVTNNATSAGTISFAPEFKFPDGTAFAATATTSAVDILTFISFDGSTLESTGLKNFS